MNEKRNWALEEYRDASTNLRHYSNLRFAQLTIFMASTGGLIIAIARAGPSSVLFVTTILPFLGVVLVIVFTILELRLYRYWKGIFCEAKKLETTLEFAQYRTRKRSKIISGNFAILLLYAITLAMWLAVALMPDRLFGS